MAYTVEVLGHPIVVDDEDAHWLVGRRVYLIPTGAKFSTALYAEIKVNGKRVGLHRMIMGTPPGMVTDHIDGNPLNNQRGNLRICTHSQNMMNRGPNGNSPHGLKGIKRDKRAPSSWYAKIKVNGKATHLGTFRTPEEAHAAYCKAASVMHGEFARTA